MKSKTLSLPIILLVSASIIGCSTSTPQATDEQKKAFQGSAMPKDFMKNMDAQKAAQDAASKAAANNGAPH